MPVQAGNTRGFHSLNGPYTWNFRLNSSKVTELEVEMMMELVRPWLEMTITRTGGHPGNAVFTLTADTLSRLATGIGSKIHSQFSELMSLWNRPG